jgi:ABC-type transporter MlaC component
MRLSSHAIAGALLVAAYSPAHAGCASEKFVTSAGTAFVNAANAGSAQAFVNAAARYADLRSIALFALGSHRNDLPKSQEAEYVGLARAYMGSFMAQNASRVSGSGLKVTACAGNTVTAMTANGKKIIFRVSGSGGSYRVQDVNVSSIWLAGQMRSNFTGVISRNGGDINALMKYLRH